MKRYYLCILLSCFVIDTYAQKGKINTASELGKLSAIEGLPEYWEGTEVHQVSSYDTTGNNDDGFSGKYSFIRKNTDSTLVIFEAKGNGVINRIWTPTPTGDMLDFYFGGEAKPSFSIKFSDLFSGKVYPFADPLTGNEIGGYYSYMPIPFKNGCKIVMRGKKLEFYQIQYRSYGKGYQVENFNPQLNQAAKTVLIDLKQNWKNLGSRKTGLRVIHIDTLLTPGQSVALTDLNQKGRITGIELQALPSFAGLQKQVDIKITWDNEDHPAVYMPVADFFGYAFGKPSMQSLLLGYKDNINYCYLPMPFQKHAKIELVYRLPEAGIKAEPIKITADLIVSDKSYNAEKEGKLYASWNRNPDAPLGKPHVFLEGNGKGHYIGTILQSQGLQPGMTLFFEGDDVTMIDGQIRLHGTGSEDYFNGGWYALLDRWDRKMSMPLHGSLDYSLPYARTGGFRLFVSDKMPFEKEILHTIEHGPEQNNKPVDYTSVAFYYANRAITSSQVEPSNDLTQVYIPDTLMIYPQLMKYSIAGKVVIDGNNLQSTSGGEVRIDLADVPKGNYKLYADIEKTPNGAELTFWQRQKQVSSPITFYAETKQSVSNEPICDLILDDNKESVTLHLKKDSARSNINIHRLILIRQKE